MVTWQAGRHSGVTDDVTRALDLAGRHLADGVPARVDVVRAELSYRTMSSFYLLTGITWTGQVVNGQAEWHPDTPCGLPGLALPAGMEQR
jgi:hypothetical protein